MKDYREILIKFSRESLENLEDYLFGKDYRPNDLYSCGTVDAECDAMIKVLDLLDEPHYYKKQIEVI